MGLDNVIVLEPDEADEIYLKSDAFLEYLFSFESEVDRQRLKNKYLEKAKVIGCKGEVAALIKAKEKELKNAIKTENKRLDVTFPLKRTQKGEISSVIDNFCTIFDKDARFNTIRHNLLTNNPEVTINGKITSWTDANDAECRRYIEDKYGIHSATKMDDAFRILLKKREYHPVRDLIESFTWDGVSRIESLLIKWLGVPDSEYSKEVSRLIFAGGIHRIYNPGCKFDDVAVLIGTKQGEGKSTFIRWLALEDRFFSEVSEFEGQKGIESIEGSWICEVAEMLATTKAKEVEAVKAFITKQTDKYRKPYDRRTTEQPRQNIFIGSTNKTQFLTDKTGNRRFYPVKVNCSGYDLFNREEEIKEEIKQCWAEALAKKDADFMQPFARYELIKEIREAQADAVEDDYRIGMIEQYLKGKEEVCISDVWENALHNEFIELKKKDSNEIALILHGLEDWERQSKTKRLGKYGPQKYWKRIKNTIDVPDGFEEEFDDFNEFD
ncbi:MAG: virulence-associated E family protein [Anaerovoracaceae bacterium]